MNLKIKMLDPNAILPTRGSEKAAGWDLYANLDAPVVIAPGRVAKISSGIAIELPEGTFGGIFARSGLSTKKGFQINRFSYHFFCKIRCRIVHQF